MDSIDKYHLLLLYITYFIYQLMGFCPMKKNLLRVKSLPWWLKTIRSSLLGARGCGILQGCHCRLVPQEIGDQIRWSTGGFTSIHQLNLLWNHINFIDFAWFCCWGLDFLWSAVISQSIWPPWLILPRSPPYPANQGVPVATFAQCHHFRLNSQARRPSFSDQCRSSGDVNHP